jgi:hypothetical protein
MADSTATISQYAYPKGHDETIRRQKSTGTITLSQGHYPVGGYPLNWSGLEGIKSIPFPQSTPSSTGSPTPINVDAKSVSNPPSGIVYQWDNVTGNLHIFIANNGVSTNSGPLIELGAAAVPQWVFSDTIQYTAEFWRQN